MNRPGNARMLLNLAVVLLIAGFAGSGLYWTVAEPPAFLATQESYQEAISAAAAAGEVTALSRADEHWRRVNSAARVVEAHTHLLFLCVLLVLFAILLSRPSGAGSEGRAPVWLATAGVVIYPAGLVAQAVDLISFGQVLSAVGAVLIVLFAGLVVAGLFRTGTTTPAAGKQSSR